MPINYGQMVNALLQMQQGNSIIPVAQRNPMQSKLLDPRGGTEGAIGYGGGSPGRAYHGTNQTFDKFGPGHVYLTPDPAIASRYADPSRFAARADARPNVVPVEANFKNPLVIDMKGKSGHHKEEIAGGDIFKLAEKGGHDGVILKNMRDIFSDAPQTQYIATKPGTVKSALTGETLFSLLAGLGLYGASGGRGDSPPALPDRP